MTSESKLPWKWIAGGVAAVGVGYAMHRYLNQQPESDPHMWLEDVLGDKCISWAKVRCSDFVKKVAEGVVMGMECEARMGVHAVCRLVCMGERAGCAHPS